MSTDPAIVAERARADLTQLRRRLRDLRRHLHAGGRAERVHTAPTPERQAARAELHRAERTDAYRQMAATPRGETPVGASLAPLDLALLDVLRDLHADVLELEAAVLDRAAPHNRPARPERRIHHLVDLLPLAAHHPDLLEHLAAEARRLNNRAGAALGEQEPPVRLSVRCPLCDALSLRLRQDADLVECFNPSCTCVDDLCGCRDTPRRTRHQWPATHWPDLATNTAA